MSVEKYLFFNSTFDDPRRYGALDMAAYWRSFLSTGLIHENGLPKLRIRANGENMTVRLDDGKALMFGHLYLKEGDLPFSLSPSSATEDRFDRIVLRYDNIRGKDDSRYIRTFLVEGTAEGPPELMRMYGEDEPIAYEISLAQIHVKAGKSFIEQSDIIDERFDQELCGLASSLVEVPTDELYQDWLNWFDSIKEATYITEGEFASALGRVKIDIASLTLEQDANNRIEGGTTFGTNSIQAFGGIHLDLTKSLLDQPYTVGDEWLYVENANDFFIGSEITIYDSLNLERRKILAIDGAGIKIEPLENNYELQSNVARSMIVEDNIAQAFKFGAFGTLDYVIIDGEPVTLDFIDKIISIGNIVFVGGGRGYIQRRSSDGVWTRITLNMPHKSGSNINLISFDTDGEVLYLLLKDPDSPSTIVSIMNTDGDVIDTSRSFTWTAPKAVRVLGNEIHVHENSNYMVLDRSNLDTIKTSINLVGAGVGNTGRRDSDRISSNSPRNFVVVHGIYQNRLVGYGVIGSSVKEINLPDTGAVFAEFVNDIFTAVLVSGNTITLKTTTNLVDWQTYTYTMNMNLSNPGALIDREGTIFVFGANGTSFYYTKKGVDDAGFPELETIGSPSEEIAGANTIHIATSVSERYKKPLFLFGTRFASTFRVLGEIAVGEGEAVNTNDIRFSLPISQNVACFTQSDRDVTIKEAEVNGVKMDVKNAPGEQQAVGRLNQATFMDVRLTLERNQTEDDSFIYKILGGVD